MLSSEMMKKPVIGILACFQAPMNSVFAFDRIFTNSAYAALVEKSGCLCSIIPSWDDEWLRICDGFLFQGGDDIDPSFYGEQRLECCGPSKLDMDRRDMEAIRAICKAGKPMLGICRGLQAVNVALGGSLYQDQGLATQTRHDRMDKPYEGVHKVSLSGRLASLYGKQGLEVNSLHHQIAKRISPVLEVSALSEDMQAEALEGKGIIAVQWHPEALGDMTLFNDLARRVRGE